MSEGSRLFMGDIFGALAIAYCLHHGEFPIHVCYLPSVEFDGWCLGLPDSIIDTL